jgi:DNA-binding NtrC family response regulator
MVGNAIDQDEHARLAILGRFERPDAAPEPALDSITALVAWFFNAPVSAIVLIPHDHIIVKSYYGLEKAQTDCYPEWGAAAIATDDVFCITNAPEDPLVNADPLVVGDFGLRFYAAAPLRTREGDRLGTLSVIDRKPRNITVLEKEFLLRMASLVADLIESRLVVNLLADLITSLANADGQLLQVLSENLARALDVDYVFIGAPGKRGNGLPTTVAFYAAAAAKGHEQDYYRTANWPYAPLLHANQDEIYYQSKAQDQFPHERRMADLRIESYAGIKLTDPDLLGFWAIAVLDTKPIRDLGLMRSALAAFAGLALAELKRRHAPSAGWNRSETSAGRPHTGAVQSIIGIPRQQQLAWLSDRVKGDSLAIREAREFLRLAIIKQVNSVLLMGETGTGKRVCALAIHEGAGARGRFVEINCAALPRELIESELFGHENTSLIGATGRNIGLFEQADSGTIFLNEIAELPLDLQIKLLSTLEGRELRRGGDQATPRGVKVIAATNRSLEIALNNGTFRHDLFFRIGSWRIKLPALRNRGDDVILLARHFIAEQVKNEGGGVEGLAPEAEDLLKQYDWPGNVGQLWTVIRRAIILESGNVISPQIIHHALEEEKELFKPLHSTAPSAPWPPYKDFKRILITEAEASMIIKALAGNRNNKTKTAKDLGLTRGQLDYRLKLIEQISGR